MLIQGGLGTYPPRKILKIRYSQVESEPIFKCYIIQLLQFFQLHELLFSWNFTIFCNVTFWNFGIAQCYCTIHMSWMFIKNVQNVFRSTGQQADPILLASPCCYHHHSLNTKSCLYLSALYLLQNPSQTPKKITSSFFLSPYNNASYTFSL